MERGEFERGGKSVQKNIEVTLYVLYADGDTLKVRPVVITAVANARNDCGEREDERTPLVLRTASAWAAESPTPASIAPSCSTTTTAPAGARWSSCPFPSTVSGGPTCASSFDTVPVSPTAGAAVMDYTVTVTKRVLLIAKDKGEKKLFGFAFTPLMREDGTTLSDEVHELYVYKVREGCRLGFIIAVAILLPQPYVRSGLIPPPAFWRRSFSVTRTPPSVTRACI